MDPADYSQKLLDIEEKLWGDLDVKIDIREILQIIAEFNRTMFDKSWLWAVPCAVELITEVSDLRRTLLVKLNSSNSQLASRVPAKPGLSRRPGRGRLLPVTLRLSPGGHLPANLRQLPCQGPGGFPSQQLTMPPPGHASL